MKIILVESDEELREELRRVLTSFPVFQLAEMLDTVEDAFQYVQTHPVDAVFTNLRPNDARFTSEGSHLAHLLTQYCPDVQTVVYTGDPTRDPCHCLNCGCAGFLRLPMDIHALQQVVNRLSYVYRLQQYKQEAANRSIMVKTRSGYEMVRLNSILFVERRSRENQIVTENGKEIVLYRYTLDEIERQLGGGFFRCYQSFIVNLSKVIAIHADNARRFYTIHFEGYNGTILLSRDKYSEIVELLQQRFAGIRF